VLRDKGCPLAYLPLTLSSHSEPSPPSQPAIDGLLEIFPHWGGIYGWEWTPGQEIGLDLRTATGRLRSTVTARASAWGTFDTAFRYCCPLREGDWFTLAQSNGALGSFELRTPQAVADPTEDTIVGSGVPNMRVQAMVEYPPDSYHSLETVSGADGSFSFDFTPLVDWEYGAPIQVQQWLNEYASVTIRDDTPGLVVLQP